MIRPIVYKSITKFAIGLAVSLLWERFINKDSLISAGDFAFFIVGVFLIAMAWFNYLGLDGLRVNSPERKPKAAKKKLHWQKDIVDFVDVKIISFDELEKDEQALCSLISNLVVGAVFVLLSLII